MRMFTLQCEVQFAIWSLVQFRYCAKSGQNVLDAEKTLLSLSRKPSELHVEAMFTAKRT